MVDPLISAAQAYQGARATVLHGNDNGPLYWSQVWDGEIAFLDVTTGDVTTTHHGFVPKLPGNANVFFNGNGAYTQVTEAGILLADNTTDDVTTGRHGFAPKLNNDPTTFLNGQGAYTAAVIETTGTFTITATGFTTTIQSTARWVKHGTLVSLFIPQLSGTSNATTFTLTGLPAGIQPTQTASCAVIISDNTVTDSGFAILQSGSGTIQMALRTGSTTWTNAGTKAIGASYLTYNLQ